MKQKNWTFSFAVGAQEGFQHIYLPKQLNNTAMDK